MAYKVVEQRLLPIPGIEGSVHCPECGIAIDVAPGVKFDAENNLCVDCIHADLNGLIRGDGLNDHELEEGDWLPGHLEYLKYCDDGDGYHP